MLTLYRASAGSGKTYQLTAEYLKLLFRRKGAFRRILAVTFTNKATDEMKHRIVEELFTLSKGGPSGYTGLLMKETGWSDIQVYARAREVLYEILHDYSAFNISTIDRFFQQTMRAFAREIGLQGGYNVELDTDSVLQEAVDKMIGELENPENRLLLNWLIRFSEEKVENGDSWNCRKEIGDLGRELFKEGYRKNSSGLNSLLGDKATLTDYLTMLNKEKTSYENSLKLLAQKGLSMMAGAGFEPEDFSGGSKSALLHYKKWIAGEVKIPTDTFRKLADNPAEWKASGKSKSLESVIKLTFQNGLNDNLKMILLHFDDYYKYNTIHIIRKNIYSLGILNDIDLRVKELVAENNIMLLSDTTQLLNRIIEGTDAPFIYEKTGTRVDHYMIDEFQDTSVMQWQNFSPLIEESLSHVDWTEKRLSNLIVGDVKQSIYRWRSSDWKILDEQLDIDYKGRMESCVLDTNYRSSACIVDFNNAFFTTAATILQNELESGIPDMLKSNTRFATYINKVSGAYRDVYQNMPEGKESKRGRVLFEFIQEDKEDEKWKEVALTRIPRVVEQWQDQGYALRDMAILVRTKSEGTMAAECLLKYKQAHPDSRYRYDLISDEALYVKNASTVKLIISLLRYLQRPTDDYLRKLAMMEYAVFLKTEELNAGTISLGDTLVDGEVRFSAEHETELASIRTLPLYEMCERLVALFQKKDNCPDAIYLQAFQDMVLDFSTRKTADLMAFLQWWEESGVKKTISTPDTQDAIRIMTIHKSKGLGFKAVLLPFCDWEIDQKPRSLLWCEPLIPPFDVLPILPVEYTLKLADSIFAFDYYQEKIHAYIDNLNVAYVAFTRAKEELVAFLPHPKEKKSTTFTLAGLLHKSITGPLPFAEERRYAHLPDHYNEEACVYDVQTPGKMQHDTAETSGNAIRPVFVSVNPDGRLQMKLKNRSFFVKEKERQYGNLMHAILSRILSVEDVDASVSESIAAGEITREEGAEMVVRLKDLLAQSVVSKWFAQGVKVLAEVQILQPDGLFLRPDRVVFVDGEVKVIDFKFGHVQSESHVRQVIGYVELVRKMGYPQVSGLIWYVESGEFTDV